MTKKLYVGNLSWDVGDDELASAVSEYGKVVSARVITDRETGRSRGFGFVEVDDTDAQKVIDSLNGSSWYGRNITVNEAKDREEGGGRGFGGGGGGGRGFGGGGRRFGR